MQTNGRHRLIDIKQLTHTTYVLQMERNGMVFESGQHILLGADGDLNQREYSIFSGTNDPYLEVLIKEVEDGDVSKTLRKTKPGEYLQVEGPLGFFSMEPGHIADGKFLFVASGTGIAPFHSMVRSHPGLDYTLLHGVRTSAEAYARDDFEDQRHILCTSRDSSGDFTGRVTDYLRQHRISTDTQCFFCGNFKMIREAMDILEKSGIPPKQLHAEVYF